VEPERIAWGVLLKEVSTFGGEAGQEN